MVRIRFASRQVRSGRLDVDARDAVTNAAQQDSS